MYTGTLTQNTGTSGDPTRWSFGLALSWTLAGVVGPGLDAAAAASRARSALAAARRLDREAAFEVEDATWAARQAEADLATAARREALAGRVWEGAMERYRAGAATDLDTRTALGDRAQAAAARVRAALAVDLGRLAMAEARGLDPQALFP